MLFRTPEVVVVGDDDSKFLEILPTYRLHKTPESYDGNEFWVFDSQDEVGGSDQHNSLLADPPDISPMIRDKIKSVLSSMMKDDYRLLILVEFWAPVAIGGRLLLSTSGLPFAVAYPRVDLAEYRIRSEGYKYNIMDVNYANNKQPMIITAFLGRLTQIGHYNSPLKFKYAYCVMIPVCCPSQSSSRCIGVFWLHLYGRYNCHKVLRMMNIALEKAGLSMFHVQNRIPYKIVHGLKPARDQIENAIKIVCESLNIRLAQVWITNHEDENHVPFSSSLQHVQKKQTLALKLTGYYNYVLHNFGEDYYLPEYYYLCDMVPLDTGESRIEKTLADYESRFYETYDKLNKNQRKSMGYRVNGIVICLKSIDTCDVCYAFEFFWYSRRVISLEDLLLKLKNCLPRLKFASGAELDEESHVIDVQDSLEGEIQRFKIFGGKQVSLSSIQGSLEGNKLVLVGDTTPSSDAKSGTAPILIPGEHTELQLGSTKEIAAKNLIALEEVNEPVVVDDIASSKKCKTAEIKIPKGMIELQFGHTMKEAACNLGVSISTLKRKCKEHRIKEWQGPPKSAKRKVSQSRNQSDTNEEDSGAILVPSASETNENQLTIKAEHSDDIIKFDLMLDTTLVLIETEIGKRFKLTPGTYKLKYLDEDNEWISLTSEEDMIYCIRSLKRLKKTVVRLRVLQST